MTIRVWHYEFMRPQPGSTYLFDKFVAGPMHYDDREKNLYQLQEMAKEEVGEGCHVTRVWSESLN